MVERIKARTLRKRVLKRIAFVDVKPVEAPRRIVQLVVKDPKLIEEVDKLDMQDLIEAEVERVGEDLVVKSLKVLFKNLEPFPIAKKEHGPDFLLRMRHLAIRGIRYPKIFYVEHVVTWSAIKHLVDEGRKRVHPPLIIASATEGGAILFPVDRFGERKFFLSESAQLYLEVMIFALGKVFSLTTSSRMEKSRTRRHLAEFRHLEAEAADYGFEDILDAQERLVKAIVRGVLEDEDASEIVKEFRGKRMDELDRLLKEKFPRITYDEAIEILRKKGVDIKRGDDLGADEERILTEDFEVPVFVTLYPTEQKAFYVKRVPDRPEVCYSADLMLPRYGEITTGGEREDDYYKLLEEIKRRGLKPEDYRRYLDLRKYGSIRHSGYGLGIERFVHRLLDLEHIRDATPFPRFYGRSTFV